jgi:hypothetical protein
MFKGSSRYPHMKRSDWISRTWLVVRKVIAQDMNVHASDLRMAEVLISPRFRPRNAPIHLVQYLEELIQIGQATQAFQCQCAHCNATEEGLGEGPGGPDAPGGWLRNGPPS